MFRTIKKAFQDATEKFTGEEICKFFDQGRIKVSQSKSTTVEAEEAECVWFRFVFSDQSLKRRFLHSIETYPPQEWDGWVTWFDEFTTLSTAGMPWADNGRAVSEIGVEVKCIVPTKEYARFIARFNDFIARKLIIKK